MLSDPTALDPLGWEALKNSLNQRVVVGRVQFVPSKRNRVWIVETDVRPVVVKRFFTGKADNEFEMLLRSRNAQMNCPLPLAKSGDYLVTEYVSGEGCESLINHMFSMAAAEKIGRWLAQFHSRLKEGDRHVIMTDAVPSNFIMSGGELFGLDLEDSGRGDPLDDVGRMAASFLDSDPIFTPVKFDLCLRMIESYERESGTQAKEVVRRYVAKHLQFDAKNRPLFRRTLVAAAMSIEKSWPELA